MRLKPEDIGPATAFRPGSRLSQSDYRAAEIDTDFPLYWGEVFPRRQAGIYVCGRPYRHRFYSFMTPQN
jgi:hypothetical protein